MLPLTIVVGVIGGGLLTGKISKSIRKRRERRKNKLIKKEPLIINNEVIREIDKPIFMDRIVEVDKPYIVEKEVIKEVMVDKPYIVEKEVIKEVMVEKPVIREVIKVVNVGDERKSKLRTMAMAKVKRPKEKLRGALSG